MPLYLQYCNQLIHLIKTGIISKDIKLPGSRKMAASLGLHRKTIIAAYDELNSQGWIIMFPSKGTYVSKKLPKIKKRSLTTGITNNDTILTGYSISSKPFLHRTVTENLQYDLSINDGIPDTRLTPVSEIARTYRSLITKNHNLKHLSYSSPYGNMILRETLVDYLNETRGLSISIDNVLITRGSQMGIYLASQILFDNSQTVVVGETNYIAADLTFKDAGAKLKRVPVDKEGIDTDAIEMLCKKEKIRAVYVTPHHHHPTTVTLSAARRIHLLKLASTYGFAVIEDDYDYDFHYNHSPILPLASGDTNGMVIYLGALCKILAPAIRVGYLVAPKNLIDEAAHIRRIIDRQGDNLLEMTMAQMIRQGDIQRHSNKALKTYKNRRDLFCAELQESLGDKLTFKKPEGGMAVWAALDKSLSWNRIREQAKIKRLYLENPLKYDPMQQGHNGIRMGFASLNEEEIKEAIKTLKSCF